jgi:nicotinate (nicotinamide) nucleotide adenylyltransferase
MKKHGILNVTKLSKTLEKIDTTNLKNKPLTVLVLSGSFNPVHSQHIATLECARNHLTKIGYNVIAGFLSPSSDDYVGNKLGKDAFDLKMRTELCDLAAEDSDWISTCGWGWAKGGQTTKEIGHELQRLFSNKYRFRALEICGADHANKFKIWRTKSIVCIGRPGYTKIVKERFELDKKTHNVPNYVNFILIEQELVDVSSTQIRKLIKEKKWEKLVATGWLSESLIIRLYILKNNGLPPYPSLIFPNIEKNALSKNLDPKDRFDMTKFVEWRNKNHPRAPFSKIVESETSNVATSIWQLPAAVASSAASRGTKDPQPDTFSEVLVEDQSNKTRPRTTFSKIVEFGKIAKTKSEIVESKKQLEENI